MISEDAKAYAAKEECKFGELREEWEFSGRYWRCPHCAATVSVSHTDWRLRGDIRRCDACDWKIVKDWK